MQNTLRGKIIDTTIIGTGININQTTFSEDIANAISMATILNRELDLSNVYSWLFRFLTKRYLQLKNGYIPKMKSEYLECLYRKDKLCKYEREDGSQLMGKITGVDEYGKLMITSADAEHFSFVFREVRFVI